MVVGIEGDGRRAGLATIFGAMAGAWDHGGVLRLVGFVVAALLGVAGTVTVVAGDATGTGGAAGIIGAARPVAGKTAEVPASTTTSSSSTSTTSTSTTTTTTAPPPPPPPAPPPTPAGAGALCIGDSVLAGAGPGFQNTLTMCQYVDAMTNRQYFQADESGALQLLAAAGLLPHTVVVALGNNGYTSAAELDALLAGLPGVQRVVLVTVQLQHARVWQDAVNAELRAAAARHPTLVAVADWEVASAGHPEWFGPDGIHISGNPAGATAYAATIAAAL
jgi:hypothetical protein